MRRYRLSPRAQNDLRNIVAWYRKHRGAQSARKTLSDIRATLRRLAREPGMGHALEFVAPPDHLFWSHRHLWIVYLRDTRPLEIVTIWDARRGDPPLG
jgi:plasmid stabilization system protein ParE